MNGDAAISVSAPPKADVRKHACQVCGAAGLELRPAVLVRPEVGECIRQGFGQWDEQGWICENDLQKFRDPLDNLCPFENQGGNIGGV